MKQLILLAIVCTLFTACDQYGKKVQVGNKNEVYYKGDGVTEADAHKLGKFFTDQGYFDSSKAATVQLLKDKDTYVVKMVVDQDEINKDKAFFTRYFWYVQNLLSSDVFNGQKTKIILANSKLEDVEPVGAIAKAKANELNTVYYNPAEEKDATAKQLADYLVKLGYFNGTKPLDVFLYKEKDVHSVRFMVDEKAFEQNKEDVLPFFQVAKYAIEKNVFGSQPAKVWLTSLELKDVEEVADLSPEEKTAVETELSKL